MTPASPHKTMTQLWHKIPRPQKVTFFTTFFTGLLVHLFMFTNKLPNHDDLGQLIETMDLSGSGRWFLQFPAAISSYFSLPWANGLLSVLYISVAAGLVVAILKIKQSFYCGLIGGLMVAFPTVTTIFTYMQSADPYFFALMLMCIAVYLANHEQKWRWPLAALLITLALGCYQAFFGVATGLMILVLILQLLNPQIPLKKTVFKALRYLGILSVSMGLYLIMAKIMMPSEGLTAYMGIDEMGQIPLTEFPRMIAKAYWYIFNFFLLNRRNVHYPFMALVFILAFLSCALLLGHFCRRKKIYREPVRTLLLGGLLLLLPLSCNIVYLMTAQDVHMLMIYGTVLILIFLPAVMAIVTADERLDEDSAANNDALPEEIVTNNDALPEEIAARNDALPKKITARNDTLHEKIPQRKRLVNLSCWMITASLLLCLFNYFMTDNKIYFKLSMAYEQAGAEAARLAARIQALDEYSYQHKIIFVGIPYRGLDNYRVAIPELGYVNMTGAINTLEIFGGNSMVLLLKNYQNFTQEMVYVPEDTSFAPELQDTLMAMPQYPDHGSAAFIDGVIYVKFSYNPS